MQLPQYVSEVLQRLEQQGYTAYAVGGCVRDSLLGLAPHDWDLCTDALPWDVVRVFNGYKVIETGLQHGTVTVLADGHPLEITTFRTEGDYSDHRHPQEVTFVKTIEEDLSRRDFTVNAIAYHPSHGFVDPFNGIEDIHTNTLRCVGKPHLRFEEDALRILRALRFSATYGFDIEPKTKQAVLSCAPLLSRIANERVQSELSRMLSGRFADIILEDLYPVLFQVIPELKTAEGMNQHSPYHCYDVLQHILKTVAYAPMDTVVRLAALLHDIGKPSCFTLDEQGNGHFYGHARIGVELAHKILKRLRFDNKTVDEVCLLIKYHDTPIEETEASVSRWLNRLGVDGLKRLLQLKHADCSAHNPDLMEARVKELRNIHEIMEKLLAEKRCFSLRDLAVDGHALLEVGVPRGKPVGEALQYLLNEVIERRLANDPAALLDAVRKRLDYFQKSR